ncbi:7TM-DISM domain-containing protein [Marinobacter sp.]|uniref:sensor histidine kinase n=1 Tax=Marinobacter sp. TaxID=50741 RepID=UPI00356325C1
MVSICHGAQGLSREDGLVIEPGQSGPVDLGAYARVHREAGPDPSIDEFPAPSSLPAMAVFEKLDGPLSFGFTRDVIWLHWQILQTGDQPATWWLQVAPTFLDQVELYLQDADGGLTRLESGDHVPLQKRPMASRHFLFPVTLTNQPIDLFVRVRSTSTVTASFNLWHPDAFLNFASQQNLLYGLLFGLTLLALVIALLSWFWLRQVFFLNAALYLLAYGGLHLSLNGFDQWLFYPASPWLSDSLVGMAGYGSGAALTATVLSYLRPRQDHPWLWGLLAGCVGVASAGTLVAALGYYPLIAPFLMLLSLVVVSGLLALCLLTLRKQPLEASLMLLLFGPGFVAIVLQALRNLGYLPLNFWTSHLWAVTALFQVLFTALAVLLKVRTEQALLRAERERSQTEREFLGMMAHELRTPLAIFESALTNIRLRVQSVQPELAPRFQRVTTALARMNTLIDNALAEDRINGDGLRFEFQPVRPSEVAEQVKNLALTSDKQRLQIVLPEDDRPVSADPYWLVLALLNLLDNAVKYSPAGGLIQLAFEWDSASLRIRVQDGGIGVPADAAGRLFERFFRAPNARALPGASGIGLGLHLVKQVVEGHGGAVWYEAAPEGGSRFTISVPAGTPS